MARLDSVKCALAVLGTSVVAMPALSNSLAEVLDSGNTFSDFRLRYENVEQDNVLKDASAMTLRSRLGYTTGQGKGHLSGFSATVEFEDVRVVGGQDSFSVPPAGFKSGRYSAIADSEVTELDQGFVRYQNSIVTAKVGRQVIAYDGHRFVGHVGWRQDRQTFDSMRLGMVPVENVIMSYSYIDQRNRIFADAADQDVKDHLLNTSIATPAGKIVAYAYLLELGIKMENLLDTYGVSLTGSADFGSATVLYALAYADQKFTMGTFEKDAEYMLAEGGLAVAGLTAKLTYESLGSDNGAYGFSTPLATLHKFNGWADVFLNTPAVGLVDTYATLSGPLVGGSLSIMYHKFVADEKTATRDELGSELDISYAKKFGKNYSAGIKYASFSAADLVVDADKMWVWVGVSF
ncbi:MAG: hypothetical protein ACI9G5_002325 [Paracoccaceae bacterium]|jgi:hypothetical protein